MTQLEAERVEFLSERDEKLFFNWIEGIQSVSKVYGRGRSVIICINDVDDDSLRELIALFYRYDIANPKQLSQFLNASNRSWFYCRDMYWFSDIFEQEK